MSRRVPYGTVLTPEIKTILETYRTHSDEDPVDYVTLAAARFALDEAERAGASARSIWWGGLAAAGYLVVRSLFQWPADTSGLVWQAGVATLAVGLLVSGLLESRAWRQLKVTQRERFERQDTDIAEHRSSEPGPRCHAGIVAYMGRGGTPPGRAE